MGDTTEIAWCDATFNPWIGCTKIASGCQNCYAEADMDKRRGRVKWGPNGTRSKTSADYWRKPLKWNRDAEKSGNRLKVFCASLADVFEDWQGPIADQIGNWIHECESCNEPNGRRYQANIAPYSHETYHEHACGEHLRKITMDDLRRDLFALIDQTPWLDWMLLTKRPGNIRRMCPMPDYAICDKCERRVPFDLPFGMLGGICKCGERVAGGGQGPGSRLRHNVHLYYSASDQTSLESGIGDLLVCRDLTPTLGLSLEPLVGEMNITPYLGGATYQCKCGFHETESELLFLGGNNYRCADCMELCKVGGAIDHVIIGGESGPGARPCNVAWIRSLVRQCRDAGVACFVKQLGAISMTRCPVCYGTSKPVNVTEVTDGVEKTFSVSLCPCRGSDMVRSPIKDKKGGDPMEWPEDLQGVRQFPKSFEGVNA